MTKQKMKITQTFVRDVKRHLKNQWHDQAWWDFDDLPETQAVIWALLMVSEPQQPREIVTEAKKALANFKRGIIS